MSRRMLEKFTGESMVKRPTAQVLRRSGVASETPCGPRDTGSDTCRQVKACGRGGMSLLMVDRLTSGYGSIPILNNVAFAVTQGESLGILGHNGMGKSTLLKTIAGELPLSGGSVTFNGIELSKLPQHKRASLGIGYVPQGRRIFSRLTVRENMEVGALAAGQPVSIVDQVLVDFPRLVPILGRRGGVLSGGEQQLLALARCLCGKPSLLLLDEPTEGIQPSIRDEISDTLKSLRSTHQLSILLVEQNVDFLQQTSDRVLVMEKGSLSRGSSADSSGCHDGFLRMVKIG